MDGVHGRPDSRQDLEGLGTGGQGGRALGRTGGREAEVRLGVGRERRPEGTGRGRAWAGESQHRTVGLDTHKPPGGSGGRGKVWG